MSVLCHHPRLTLAHAPLCCKLAFSGWGSPPGSLGSSWLPPEWPAGQPGVAGRIMAPKEKSTLVPRTCTYVTSRGQRCDADVMDFRTTGEEVVLGSQVQRRNCDDRSRPGRRWASGFEEGGARSGGKPALQELADARKRILLPERNQPCPHLDFGPGRPVCDFSTHASFQPASLGSFGEQLWKASAQAQGSPEAVKTPHGC